MADPWKRKEVIGGATLYLGDCLEILPTLPKVDAVITDPPYGIGLNVRRGTSVGKIGYSGGDYRVDWEPVSGDDAPFSPESILAISVPTIMWGANNFASRLPNSNGWLVWDKACGVVGFTSSDCELAWTNCIGRVRYISHLWHGFKRASQAGDRVNHPTEKPIAIMKWCIEMVPDSNIVLDPFMGSGTTGVACMNLGRKFIGIEIEPKYFDIACERIENAQRQQRMFA